MTLSLIFAMYVLCFLIVARRETTVTIALLYGMMLTLLLSMMVCLYLAFKPLNEGDSEIPKCPDVFYYNKWELSMLDTTADLCYLTLGAFFISVMIKATRTINDIAEMDNISKSMKKNTSSRQTDTSSLYVHPSNVTHAGDERIYRSRCLIKTRNSILIISYIIMVVSMIVLNYEEDGDNDGIDRINLIVLSIIESIYAFVFTLVFVRLRTAMKLI